MSKVFHTKLDSNFQPNT